MASGQGCLLRRAHVRWCEDYGFVVPLFIWYSSKTSNVETEHPQLTPGWETTYFLVWISSCRFFWVKQWQCSTPQMQPLLWVRQWFSHTPLKSLGCWRVCILKYKCESLFFCVGAEEQHLGPSQTLSYVSEARMNPHHPPFGRHQLLHHLYLGFFKSCLPLF